MRKKYLLLGGALSAATAFPAGLSAAETPEKMNVIFILADDLGWSDTTLYGQTSLYETPNIERLAARGMTFTRAYSASPLCSPTRASILTGQTPARNGFTAPHGHVQDVILKASVRAGAPPECKARETVSVTRLNTTLPTLVKLIKADGYATAHFGKWHLGLEPYVPTNHGFDVDIPNWQGPGPAGSFVAPWKFPNFKENYPGEHIEDRMAEEAVKWMGSLPKDQPFYLNYWQFSVHAPFDAKEDLIEKYRKKVDPENPQHCAVYAAMVNSLDDAVGSLLDAVDREGIADHTAIVFISDNGGNMYDKVEGSPPTSNAPLRGGKGNPWEGGIRVPCIVVWPGITTPGTRSDEIIQTCDFYPTILDRLGIALPKDYAVDGMDITPALEGGHLDRKAIFTYFPHSPPAVPDWLPPAMAVHSGDWKLIRLFCQGENGAHDYRLYNLAEDIGETNNLAARYPEKVKELDQLIEKHIQDTGAVVPLPNPKFDPAAYDPSKIGVAWYNANTSGPVAGWLARGTCTLEKGDGTLIVKSTGGDPYFMADKLKPVSGGPFTIRFRMMSDSSGDGIVFYNDPASERRSVAFPVKHDGEWHEYDVKIPPETLNLLRLDPSTNKGHIEIDWVRIEDASGKTVREWDFQGEPDSGKKQD